MARCSDGRAVLRPVPAEYRTSSGSGWHHGRVPYEYRAVTIPRHATREQARDMLAIHAEYGDWELTRHAIYADGKRRVTVRRRLRAEPLPPMAT